MEDFISRIIEIDKQARQIAVDADSLKAQADKEIAEKNAQVKKETDAKTAAAVEKFKADEQQRSDKKLAEKKALYEQQAQQFDAVFKQNKENWAEELCKRALSQN